MPWKSCWTSLKTTAVTTRDCCSQLPASTVLHPGSTLSANERKLLKGFKRLSASERETVLAFVEFLGQRESPPQPLACPEPIPRPPHESVVGAIKRLSATYSMVDKDTVFHEVSGLMAQHLVHGKPAPEAIDELEAVFRRQYERLRST